MAYLTFNNLTSRAFTKANSLNESISARTYLDKKVFLSYRRMDRDYVDGVVRFLKRMGVAVYIDYLDETLEEKTNDVVAQQLRDRIKECSKFITLATPNSTNSKWMPWELGLGDRIINYANVAILPLTNDPNNWSDQEYGKIYGRIESTYPFSIADSNDWYIIYPNDTRIKFKEWLNK